MAILRATAVLNKRTGVPKDAARNVWHFSLPSVFTDAQVGQVGTQLALFYQGFVSYLSASLTDVANGHRIELADVTPGNPGEQDDVVSKLRGTTNFGLGIGTTSLPLPNQVGITFSFRGDVAGVPEEQGLSRPASSRRGRVTLGPVNVSVINRRSTTTQEPEVIDDVKEAILDSYDALTTALATIDPLLRHVVYSRTLAQGFTVVSASVDNQFDTVRRRKVPPSDKFVRTITQGAAQAARAGTEVPVLAS